jgi:hypothetical protein
MEVTGELQSISKDWQSGKFIISLEINEKISQEMVEEIQNCKLAINLKKWRAKRSLDANAYCWALMTKIAEVVDSSKDEIYEDMLQKYGYLLKDDEGYVVVTVKADLDISKMQGHWKFYKSNGKFSSYLAIKGSSEYDTKEMAHFIDQIVLEAKELGIETLPPDELQRMKEAWGK